MGFTIKTTQKGGGGPPSTIVPALKVLNKATANKQAIKASSPDKTLIKDFILSSKEAYQNELKNKGVGSDIGQ